MKNPFRRAPVKKKPPPVVRLTDRPYVQLDPVRGKFEQRGER